mmetsp:Transcript_1063/g.1977  ORF Transcript_1063/g.1977 Transcript_1063/m.1977 type:complete len:85 (-) Transcript_1063:365-619(-)
MHMKDNGSEDTNKGQSGRNCTGEYLDDNVEDRETPKVGTSNPRLNKARLYVTERKSNHLEKGPSETLDLGKELPSNHHREKPET